MGFEELLDKICQAKDMNYPFVIYRKPNGYKIDALMQKDQNLHYAKDFKESGFVMAPFNVSDDTVLLSENNCSRFSCNYRSEDFSEFQTSDTFIKTYSKEEAKNRHVALVEKGISRIKQGDFEKVVLSRAEEVALESFDISRLFKRMLVTYPSAFIYIWFHPKIGLWSGASPETLVKTKGAEFHTMSLAGTQKYEGNLEISWGAKEIREQQIVTDHIIESMEGIPLDTGQTYTKKAGNLLHLCNDIVGQLDTEASLSELLSKLHPTAAVCGFPKEEVKQFILNHEGYDRSYYTGFVGELNRMSTEVNEVTVSSHLFVNLRCMEILINPSLKAVLYIGGGVTADSIPESEWEETVQKSRVMKRVL